MSATLVARIPRITSCVAAIVLVVAAPQPAGAEPVSPVSAMSIETLKGFYLDCELAATAGRLNGNDVMHCSLVYEELKKKAFAGEFKRIKSWLDSQLMPLG